MRAPSRSVDPNVQLNPMLSLNERFARTLVTPRFNMLLFAAFAFVAIALAAVGVFGVIAYSIASRTREIGVRMALGATPPRLVADVVRRGMLLTGLGMAIGLAGTLSRSDACSRRCCTACRQPTGSRWRRRCPDSPRSPSAPATFPRAARRNIDPLTALRQE